MKLFLILLFNLFLISNHICQSQSENDFQFGADRLLTENFNLIKNKKLGVITNHTAVLSNGVHLVDTLHTIKDIEITALFGPEHGIRGDNAAGQTITHNVDSKTGIPVYSLYGKDKKPTKEMLKDVDVLIFDIQDVGARFYTYISTLFYIVQAAAENNIPLIVLDRPNPINGIYVDGPIRKPELNSFAGIAPLPIAHGMTVGELAQYFASEKLIGDSDKVNLTVIKMRNWNRNLFYDSFQSSWIKPSPNIPSLEAAIIYPGTCLLEGTNISEGRGTDKPFLKIGAPFLNSNELIKELNKQNIDGVDFEPITFTPAEITGAANNPKYKNENCNGIEIKVKDRDKCESVKFGIILISAINKLYPNEFKFRDDSFDRLVGDRSIRQKIMNGIPVEAIIQSYQNELNDFKEIRAKYLLY
jgi:beta-N-acetylhexosaminidase